MKQAIALQLSPEAKGAYFSQMIEVAKAELHSVLGEQEVVLETVGNLHFLHLQLELEQLPQVLRLSFVQGVYRKLDTGLLPLDQTPEFILHDDFVFGSKFKGKTNERLTQLLINLGLAQLPSREGIKLLDPMCGRATTLLWAMRYGIDSWGIELDVDAQGDVHRILKKWSKIHRQKHQLSDGFLGQKNKKGLNKYLDFSVNDVSFRMAQGDGSRPHEVFKKQKFDLLISDLPYGVQHFASQTTRNPLQLIEQCVMGWQQSLKAQGVVVIAYNSNNPKREKVVSCFENAGFEVLVGDFSHRMSESIVRDIIVAKKRVDN